MITSAQPTGSNGKTSLRRQTRDRYNEKDKEMLLSRSDGGPGQPGIIRETPNAINTPPQTHGPPGKLLLVFSEAHVQIRNIEISFNKNKTPVNSGNNRTVKQQSWRKTVQIDMKLKR
jgi:hypothetical protein